jgi:hypothetical protein
LSLLLSLVAFVMSDVRRYLVPHSSSSTTEWQKQNNDHIQTTMKKNEEKS